MLRSQGKKEFSTLIMNLRAIQEIQVQSLSQEDPLEKEMATPLKYSCLGNPMNREAWQGTVHGVANSRT